MTPRFEAYVRAAVGDATTCPHGHPIKVGERIDGVPLADCAVGATSPSCAWRTRPRTCCTTSRPPASSPGPTGTITGQRRRAGPVSSTCRTRPARSPSASPRPSRCSPTPRRRRAPRCPSSSCSAAALRPLALQPLPVETRRRGQLAPGGQPAPQLGVDGGVVEQVEVLAPPRWLYWSIANCSRSPRPSCDQALGRSTSRSPTSAADRMLGVAGQRRRRRSSGWRSPGTAPRCRCWTRTRRGRGPPSPRRRRSRSRGP